MCRYFSALQFFFVHWRICSQYKTFQKGAMLVDEYYRAIRALPSWLAQPLARLPAETVETIQELRMRTGCEIALTMQGRQCLIRTLPGCPPELRTLHLTGLQMEEIFYTLCGGSVHTHEMELTEGYITTPTGCRVGVAGQFVQSPGQSASLQRVLSFNFRIARDIPAALPEAFVQLLEQHFVGLLLVGEPGSGKTTVLRQIAEVLAQKQRLVAVVDERNELFPPGIALPPLDRIGGLGKARAVQMALRTLAPQVVVLDELGGLDEAVALEQGFFSGVDFIASIHAPDADAALCRPQVQELLRHKMVRYLAVLSGREAPGTIRAVQAL